MAEERSKKRWYLRWWAITLYVIIFFIIVGSLGGDGSEQTTNNQQVSESTTSTSNDDPAQNPVAETTSDTTSESKPMPVQEELTYTIVDRWSIPNGGEGQVIVISNKLLNEGDMARLGELLKKDNTDNRNSFISVFDDIQAAKLRDKVLSYTASDSENTLYDEHFVGQYNKNANTGFHKFNIYLDGVMGDNNKTIEY